MKESIFNKLKTVLCEDMRQDVFEKESLPVTKQSRQELFANYQRVLHEKRMQAERERG